MEDLLTLSNQLQLSTTYWLLAFFSALVVGLSKAGIKGLGVIVVTLMALVFGGKASTGIVLLLLIIADVFAVIYYNRHAQWYYLMRFLPWMIAGVLVGVYVGKDMPEEIFKQGLAVIILITVIMMFWWEGRKEMPIPDYWWFAGIMGFAAGFTTMVGNLAGAFATIFFLAMKLPKNQFIGTGAWLFFIINLFKLPFHSFVWETISLETGSIILRLVVGIFIGLYLGIILVKKIEDQQYRKFILFMTALGALLIFFR